MRNGPMDQAEKEGLLEKLNEERQYPDGATLLQVWRSRNRANGPQSPLLLAQPLEEGADRVDGDRKESRGVFFCRDLHQGLQIT